MGQKIITPKLFKIRIKINFTSMYSSLDDISIDLSLFPLEKKSKNIYP